MTAPPRAEWLIRREEFEARLNDYPLRHGTMRMMLYRPDIPDQQAPHAQDELYIVATGEGTFTKAGETVEFASGDAIFVAAGIEHCFDRISDDATIWVVFWGAKGGE
ncbi:MAG: cupin domain-containing protein [Novosphingobium sp.]